jgi:hypothetical protein
MKFLTKENILFKNLANIPQTISSIIAIPALVFTLYQLSSTNDSVKIALFSATMSQITEFNKTMRDNPDFQRFIYGREEMPDDYENKEKVYASVDLLLDIMEGVFSHDRELNNADLFVDWRKSMRESVHGPVFCDRYSLFHSWYSNNLREIVEAGCKKICRQESKFPPQSIIHPAENDKILER